MIERKSIAEVGEIKMGLSSYYLNNQDKDGKEIPLINVKDIQDGKIDSTTVDHIKVRETDALGKARVSKGDLILSTTGTFKAAVADESIDGFAISANLNAVTFSEDVNPEVVAAYLNSLAGQRELNKRAGGGVTAGLNKNQLNGVLIPVPESGLQQDLAQFIAFAQEYSNLLSKEAEIWRNIIDAVIIKTLDGQGVVKK